MGHYIEESNQLCQDKSLIYSSLFWAYDRPELKTKDLLSKTTQNSLQGAEVGLTCESWMWPKSRTCPTFLCPIPLWRGWSAPSAASTWIVPCSGQPPISKASCSISKPILTIIARIAHGRGDHQTTHRLGRSPTSDLIDGNLTAEACIKPR